MTSIYQQWRDEVKARDWVAVHIAGDRRDPIFLNPFRWRKSGEASRVEKGKGYGR